MEKRDAQQSVTTGLGLAEVVLGSVSVTDSMVESETARVRTWLGMSILVVVGVVRVPLHFRGLSSLLFMLNEL